MPYRYRVVDVFTTEPLQGNPLAVFPDASEIDESTMQKIARELNLSETTFVLPPTHPNCCARVRIFTPNQEMTFAGHPIIGTSFVMLEEGILPKHTEHLTLDIRVGPVAVRVDQSDGPLIWLTTPKITWGATYERGLCAGIIGLNSDDLLDIAPQFLDAGNLIMFIALKGKEAVDRARLDTTRLHMLKSQQENAICVFLFTPTSEGAYSRMFAPDYGILEDPATGSATGPLAAYMMRHQLVSSVPGTRFHSEQGTKMGRRSILYVQINGTEGVNDIEVGGYVVPVALATMML